MGAKRYYLFFDLCYKLKLYFSNNNIKTFLLSFGSLLRDDGLP